MTLIRYNPRRKMMRYNDDFNRGFFPFAPTFFESFDTPVMEWRPSVDITENDANFIVKAELAGLNKDDINVSLKNDVLTIKGEKSSVNDAEKDDFKISERRYGKFVRSFKLPSKVDRDKIDASYKDGVLTLELPKIEEAVPKNIEINLN